MAIATEQEYYQRLATARNERPKKLYRDGQAQARENVVLPAEQKKLSMKNQLALARKMSSKEKAEKKQDDLIESAKNLPLAFTAVSFSEDIVQFVVIIVSVIADLFTLIPIVGGFFGIFFSAVIWILYAVDGHLKGRIGKKVIVTATAQAAEIFGFAINVLPFFTISALVNYWFVLADRRTRQEAEKN